MSKDMRISAILLATTLAVPGLAGARRAPPSPQPKPQEPSLPLLQGHTFNITVRRGTQEYAGVLRIGRLAVEHALPGNTALNATIEVPATAVNNFYGYTGALATYFSRFETSTGNYVLGSFVFVGQSTPQRTPNSVSIVIGSPQTGSLSGGAGIDTLQGDIEQDGSIRGDGTIVSGYPDEFAAVPAQ